MPVRVIDLYRPPQRIALLKPSALGDIMHSLPVLSALRQRFPHAHIAWIVNRVYAPLLEQHPDLNEVVPFDRGALNKSVWKGSLEYARFLNRLRACRFDMVIDLQGLLRTGLMSLASGAGIRIGLRSAREGARLCYTHRVDDRSNVQHAVDRYWRVIEALGEAPMTKTFHLPIRDEARAWALEALSGAPRPWIAVGVGSRWLTKRWPPEHFARLVRHAQSEFGGTAIFVGTSDEAALAEQAAQLVTGPQRALTGKTTLPQLAAVLSLADAMIANDTGPLHLAAALGRPVVAPYTCTWIERTGPYGQLDRAVQTAVWCRGSYLRTCPRMDCMAELTPQRMWEPLEAILCTWQRQNQAA